MTVVAFIDDLADRSRLSAAVPGVTFSRDPTAAGQAHVIVVDLVRYRTALPQIRDAAPAARIVCFGPHVNLDRAAAEQAGAEVMPRSRFFRDPVSAVGPARRRSTPG